MSLYKKNRTEKNVDATPIPIIDLEKKEKTTKNVNRDIQDSSEVDSKVEPTNNIEMFSNLNEAQTNFEVNLEELQSSMDTIKNWQLPESMTVQETIEEIITFIPVNAGPTIDLLFHWNDALTYRYFLKSLYKFHSFFDEDTEQKSSWQVALNNAIDTTQGYIHHIQNYIEGAKLLMHHEQLLRNIFADDLENLKPLEMIPTYVKDREQGTNFDALLDAIKSEIHKGTKVSYKMLQELQSQLETFNHQPIEEASTSEIAITSQQKLIDLTQEIEKLKQRSKQSIDLMIKAVDTLDLIRNAAEQAELNESWINQLDQAIQNYLFELEKFGVKEIETKGELLDGNYMISIGTIPLESATGYKKYQVYLVHERGFKNINNDTVIREAKVINVY